MIHSVSADSFTVTLLPTIKLILFGKKKKENQEDLFLELLEFVI
jgi:hypothetical protein